MFTTGTKFLILFLSDGNPLWKTVMTQPLSIGKLASYMNVSTGTIENWKSGRNVHEAKFEAALDRILVNIKTPPVGLPNKRITKRDAPAICLELDEKAKAEATELVKRFRAGYSGLDASSSELTAKPHVYAFAKEVFNMSVEQGQRIIDEVIYDRFSLLPNICYKSRAEAEAAFRRFGGTYLLWARREGRWLQAKVRVRYVVDIRSRTAVRCKMNAPVINPLPYSFPHWEYDGFLTVCENKVCWVFEQREAEGLDFFYVMTCRGNVFGRGDDAKFTLAGKYLTAGQDKKRSIVSDDVLFQRIFPAEIAEDKTADMREDIREITDKDEGERITRLFEEFQAQA